MARIDINTPYEVFLKSQVESGLFRSITAAAEDAIRKQMLEQEKLRVASVHATIAKGEADIKAGKTIGFHPNLMAEISQRGKEASLVGKPIKHDVRP